MAGMAAAINEKGYAATAIGDIVRHSRVSKRTLPATRSAPVGLERRPRRAG